MQLDWLYIPETWVSLFTLIAVQIVLGIDNVVFLSVIASRLKDDAGDKARRAIMILSAVLRLSVLLFLIWLVTFAAPLFSLFGHEFSLRDLVLLGCGMFLLYHASHEISQDIDGGMDTGEMGMEGGFVRMIIEVAVIDLIFSMDSIIAAIGLGIRVEVMVAATLISVSAAYAAAGVVSRFLIYHPVTKIMTSSFLILIGTVLVADGTGFHIPRAYVYFAILFAAAVEILNVMAVKWREPK